ncbi:MAG TPA: PAS domain S-box protein [Fimbriimonas sp.]|nr:PAS domain S-box protein [Fimbriimonas sp.]
MADRSPELSPREQEVIDLAAGGHTDAGIAHKLGISVPTVGTYWNRVRAKVGPHSRTELVALLLMKQSERTIADLQARYESLLSDMQRESERSPWKDLVANAPDAIILVDNAGSIREANLEAERLFGYGSGELPGQPLFILVPTEKQPEHIEHLQKYIKNPERKRMGDHVGTMARRKDGGEFLIAADLRGFQHDGETLVACVIRPVTA